MSVDEETLLVSLDRARQALEDARDRLEPSEVLEQHRHLISFFEDLIAEARSQRVL